MFQYTTGVTQYFWDIYSQEAIAPMIAAHADLSPDKLAERVARFADELEIQRSRRFDLKDEKTK